MSTKPRRLDRWDHVQGGGSMATSVWAEEKFVTINSTIKANGKITDTFVPRAYGDELDRMIAALQAARDEEGKRR